MKYLQPCSSSFENNPSITDAINCPNVMNIWYTVISLPLISAGAHSATYIGQVVDAYPMQNTNEILVHQVESTALLRIIEPGQ